MDDNDFGPVARESLAGALEIQARIRESQEHLDSTLSVFPYVLDCAYSYPDVFRLRESGPENEGVWVEDIETGEVVQMFYLEYLTARDAGLVRHRPLAPDVAPYRPSEATASTATSSSPGAA